MENKAYTIFKNVVVKTFSEKVNTTLQEIEKKSDVKNFDFDITGIISIIGDCPSNIAMRITQSTADQLLHLYNKTNKTNLIYIRELLKELLQTFGENIIDSCNDHTLVLSIPEIISGKNHDLYFTKCTYQFDYIFSTDFGLILIAVAHGR